MPKTNRGTMLLSEFLYLRYIVPRIFEVCSGQVSEEVKVKDNRTAIRKMRAAKKKKKKKS